VELGRLLNQVDRRKSTVVSLATSSAPHPQGLESVSNVARKIGVFLRSTGPSSVTISRAINWIKVRFDCPTKTVYKPKCCLYLGTKMKDREFTAKCFPRGDDDWEFEYPEDRQLTLKGAIADTLMRAPNILGWRTVPVGHQDGQCHWHHPQPSFLSSATTLPTCLSIKPRWSGLSSTNYDSNTW